MSNNETPTTRVVVNRRGLAHTLSLVSAVLFAASVAWVAVGHVATPRIALEFAGGATLLVAVHELGHVAMLRRFRIPASPPFFIPFIGALIVPKGIEDRDAKTESWVGIAGPVAGTVASYLTVGLYVLTGHAPLLLIAFASMAINALNMLPVPPLDGGRAVAAITPWLWIGGLAGLCVLAAWARSFVIWLALTLALLAVIRRLRMRKLRSSYYEVSLGSRLALIVAYLGTWVAIVGGIALCVAIGGDAIPELLN